MEAFESVEGTLLGRKKRCRNLSCVDPYIGEKREGRKTLGACVNLADREGLQTLGYGGKEGLRSSGERKKFSSNVGGLFAEKRGRGGGLHKNKEDRNRLL